MGYCDGLWITNQSKSCTEQTSPDHAALKRAGIRRRNPYHTRHTYACWLLSAGANPSFIANQMGHENAQRVCHSDTTWIEEMNGDRLNARLAM